MAELWLLEDEAHLCMPAKVFVAAPAAGQCPVCMDFPLQPQGLACQHIFCRGCLEKYVRLAPRRNACPTCRQDTVDSMKPNYSMCYVITGSTFRCIHGGCFWTGQGYAAAEKHWRQECAVMLAESRAKIAEESLESAKNELADKENVIRVLQCQQLEYASRICDAQWYASQVQASLFPSPPPPPPSTEPPPAKRTRLTPSPGVSSDLLARTAPSRGDGVDAGVQAPPDGSSDEYSPLSDFVG